MTANNGNAQNNQNAAIGAFIRKTKGALNDVTNKLSKAPEGFNFSQFKEGEALVNLLATNFKDQFAERFESGKAANDPDFKTFTLHSGIRENFIRMKIDHDKIEEVTCVPSDINGRTQEQLDENSLSDIMETIKDAQYYEAIGYIDEDGNIIVLDGSRRRAACILAGCDFLIYVCNNLINKADAKILAARLQTAKEHNIQEKGRTWQSLKDEGYKQKELAEMFQTSEATISRGLKYNQIDRDLMVFFPDPDVLTTSHWTKLHDFSTKQLSRLKITAKDAVTNLMSSEAWDNAHKEGKLTTNFIIDNLGRHKPVLTKASKSTQFTTVATYGPRSFIKSNGHAQSFQMKFGRLTKEQIEGLERVAKEYLNECFNKE